MNGCDKLEGSIVTEQEQNLPEIILENNNRGSLEDLKGCYNMVLIFLRDRKILKEGVIFCYFIGFSEDGEIQIRGFIEEFLIRIHISEIVLIKLIAKQETPLYKRIVDIKCDQESLRGAV